VKVVEVGPLALFFMVDYFRLARQNEAARAADATREVNGAVVA
jgi:hypothetical protein